MLGYRQLSVFLSILGIVPLSYVAGAGALFYQLPSSGWLVNAFLSAELWHSGELAVRVPSPPPPRSRCESEVDWPEKTYDGFTLYSSLNAGPQAFLVNMRREVVHRWVMDFNDIWPAPTHIQVTDPAACFFGSYLYPNGDLLVTFHGACLPTGCGLARIDAQSRLLWAYTDAMHHDVDVAEDGTIYALSQKYVSDVQPGLENVTTPMLLDYVHTISPDGMPIREPISVLEAFLKSPFAPFLASLEKPVEEYVPPPGSTAPQVKQCGLRASDHRYYGFDALHTNSVKVLSRKLAKYFPQFKAGYLLISVRNLNVIAMLDPEQGRIVWATRGPWLAQHDPQFLENGRLLIFDNLGSPRGSRILEYNPQDQALPWSFPGANGETFFSSERGMSQRLPNGNTFIADSEGGKLFEVTPDKQVVWSHGIGGYITTARRYGPREIAFLEGQRPRP